MRLNKHINKGRRELILAWAIPYLHADMCAHSVISVGGQSIEYTEETTQATLVRFMGLSGSVNNSRFCSTNVS